MFFACLILCPAVVVKAQGIGMRGGETAQDTSGIDRSGSRIMGDTIKNKYDAKSTRFTYERNFKFNDIVFQNPDTIPDNLHRFTDLEKGNNFIQNLGNIGTAQRSLFFEPGHVIGRTSGYHVYDAFYTTPDQVQYFDTRSPYTDISAFFGGGGRAITDVLFTFNDSTHFNIGLDFNSIRADKQLSTLRRGDRNVRGTDWNIFGFLRPQKLPPYLLLFNMTQMDHTVFEQGGIREAMTEPQTSSHLFFDYRDEDVVLQDAKSHDKRQGLHIYQQYDLDSIFQVYHSGTFVDQTVLFTDIYNLSGSDSLLYTQVKGKVDTIRNEATFREFNNELGIKGRTRKFSYTLFYRSRNLRYRNLKLARQRNWENYLGGTLRQQITPEIFLTATGEYLLGGNYLLSGDFKSSFFNVRYSRLRRKPGYLASLYKGQQKSWSNSFADEVSDNLYGEIILSTNRLRFSPYLRFNRIANYLYYGSERKPEQAASDVLIISPGLHFDYQLSPKWKWASTAVFSHVSGGSAKAYRIPALMANGQIAFRSQVFGGKMMVHTGADLHYRSTYKGLAYDPLVQQFYVQDKFEQKAFVKVDLFLNFRVLNFIFFAKLAHFNQGLLHKGYFITPHFTGTRGTFDMGVTWRFYD